MSADKLKYGLAGYPLGHSFSKDFFNKKFAEEGIPAEYLNFEIPDIKDITEIFSLPGLSGLNITIPYKESVLNYIDRVSAEAAKVGAVNVIEFVRNSDDHTVISVGHNTDVIGFRESIRPLLSSGHTSALVLGTGGASKAVVQALSELGIKTTIVSRDIAKGDLTYASLNRDIIEQHTVIVNATPLGTWPETDCAPDIPYQFITPLHVCHDVVYNPAETKFMKLCRQHGAIVKNGHDMLKLQAIAAWKIWNRNTQ